MTDHRWRSALRPLTGATADPDSSSVETNDDTSLGEAAPVVWTIVVAGGTGSRFGGPKTQEVLHGQRVLDWSLRAAKSYAKGVVLVVSADRLRAEHGRAEHVVEGGATRAESVRRGLAAVPSNAEIVLVHDAARPLATPRLFERVIEAVLAGADAVIPAMPVVDTVKRVAGGHVVETVDRADLVAVQTPQGFRASVLRAAHAGAHEATDDAALVETIGGTVVVVDGEVRNLKLTTADDLAVLGVLASLPAPVANVAVTPLMVVAAGPEDAFSGTQSEPTDD